MALQFKARITRKAFEAKLIEDFTIEALSAVPYTEHNGQKLTLYYVGGRHVATWTKGEGWIFVNKGEHKHEN